MKRLVILLFLTSCTLIPHTPPGDGITYREATPQYNGLDILLLARQDVNLIKNNLQSGQCIGALAGIVGGIINPMTTLLNTGKVPCFRIHGSFCNHGSQCSSGECKPNDNKCMKGKAVEVNKLAAKFPGSKCFYSPRLEYNSKNKNEVENWFTIARNNAPNCTLVASPLSGAYIPANVLVEKHGNNPSNADVTSNDGEDAFQANAGKYRTIARVLSMWWTYRCNLRLSSEKGTPLPPMQRPLVNRLRKEDIQQLQLIQKEPAALPDPPAQCKSVYTLSYPELLKASPEDYATGNDAREKAPLLVLKRKVNQLDFLAPNGNKIGCFKYYGAFPPNLNRYYAGNCSPETRISLYNKSEGEHSFALDNGQCIRISAIKRIGYFR